MKVIAVIVLISLFGLVPPVFAKGKNNIQTQGGFPVPKISIPKAVIDFKTVLEGVKVSHTFPIENKGDAPLTITNIKTTCGCTAAYYTRDSIPPGGRGMVTLQFNTNGYGGKSVKKTAYVYSNDPKSKKMALRLKGKVGKLADINPESINLHGHPGENIRTVVEIVPSEEFPFHIIGEPRTGKDTYRCTIEEQEGKYILTAENLAKKPMIYSDSVFLETDRPEKSEIRIRVIGKIKAKK